MAQGSNELLPYLAVSLPVVSALGVAWLANRSGRKAAGKESYEPQEHGEHAHTRDVIKLETQRIMDRLNEIIRMQGEVRQEEQKAISAARIAERYSRSRRHGREED